MKKSLSLILASLILMSAALWNGFPFIYPDIGTYLGSGFTPEMPIDRPITYGLFIFATSFGGFSIWFTIFTQALMTAYVLQLTLDFISKKQIGTVGFISLISILTLSSSITFPVGQLMPDFSTPIMLLSLLLIIIQAPLSILERRLVFFLFFLTNAFHISHILLNMSVLAIFTLFYFLFKNLKNILKIKTIGILTLLTLLGILTTLPPLSKSSHVFRMGNLVHNHILQTYLADNCGVKNFQLCTFKNEIPNAFDAFVWDKNSPLSKMGWKESKKEFQTVIGDIYTTPKYLKMIAKASFENTLKQLQYNAVCEGNLAFLPTEPYIVPLETYCHALEAYEKSRQFNKKVLISPNFHAFHKIIIAFSLFFLAIFGLFEINNKQLKVPKMLFIGGILIAILLNAWISATFIYPVNRFGCKMIWLLPFLTLIFVLNLKLKLRKYLTLKTT